MLSFAVMKGLYSFYPFYEILKSRILILKQVQDDITESGPGLG